MQRQALDIIQSLFACCTLDECVARQPVSRWIGKAKPGRPIDDLAGVCGTETTVSRLREYRFPAHAPRMCAAG